MSCCACVCFFFSSRRRHTRCALVTGVQTCALPILGPARLAIPEPTENDPNWQVYQRAAQRADMFGRIELVRLPSPGRILHGDEVVPASRSEEHTSELQSLMRISYAVFCLKKKQAHK